jgi:hypothetical protein
MRRNSAVVLRAQPHWQAEHMLVASIGARHFARIGTLSESPPHDRHRSCRFAVTQKSCQSPSVFAARRSPRAPSEIVSMQCDQPSKTFTNRRKPLQARRGLKTRSEKYIPQKQPVAPWRKKCCGKGAGG